MCHTFFAGHSKGGVHAAQMTAYFHQAGLIPSHATTHLHVFGAPNVGHRGYADALSDYVKANFAEAVWYNPYMQVDCRSATIDPGVYVLDDLIFEAYFANKDNFT